MGAANSKSTRIGRVKTGARNKLLNLIVDSVRLGTADLREQVERLARTVEDQRADLDELRRHEHRARHDIGYAADMEAAAQSAEFVEEFMPKAVPLGNAIETMSYALAQVRARGMALEFGVASGDSLRRIAAALKDRPGISRIAGFDSFEGLPETWRQGFEKGMFAQTHAPGIDDVEIVTGMFGDTLPQFLQEHREPVSFLHLDADLYSSTAEVLEAVGARLKSGAVIVLDDFFNYPGWQNHEHRAWKEHVTRARATYEFIAYTADHQQVVARVQ